MEYLLWCFNISAVDNEVQKILKRAQLCLRDFTHFLSNWHNYEGAAVATERTHLTMAPRTYRNM